MDHCLAKHLISVYGDITLDDADAAAPRASEAARRRAQQRQHHDGTQELLEFVGGEGAALHECGSYTMLAIAEHLKKALSASDAAEFSCRRRKGKGKGGEEEEMIKTLKVTRREFEGAACGEVFARALAPVDRVLESNGMKHEEVDEVVMVGGELFGWLVGWLVGRGWMEVSCLPALSPHTNINADITPPKNTNTGTTRIPKVREMVRAHLHVESLNTHIDPDITVAVGAACVVD